MRNVYFEAALN